MRQITATQLHTQLTADSDAPPVLLDVREPHEFAYCHIEGSLNLPMNTIPARLAELDPDATLITICHHGMRSAAVADFLIGRGFVNVINLTGGIHAWALEVDPDMPRY